MKSAAMAAGVHAVAVFHSGREALGSISTWNAQVCAVEQQLPDGTGEHFIRSARTMGAHARFLLVARVWDGAAVQHAVRQGADGVLPEGRLAEDLGAAVRDLADHQAWMHRTALRAWMDHLREPHGPPVSSPLSPREHEVMRLLAEGLSYRAIGERLFIAPNTVKNHVHHIITKLGARNRIEAVRNYRDRGIE